MGLSYHGTSAGAGIGLISVLILAASLLVFFAAHKMIVTAKRVLIAKIIAVFIGVPALLSSAALGAVPLLDTAKYQNEAKTAMPHSLERFLVAPKTARAAEVQKVGSAPKAGNVKKSKKITRHKSVTPVKPSPVTTSTTATVTPAITTPTVTSSSTVTTSAPSAPKKAVAKAPKHKIHKKLIVKTVPHTPAVEAINSRPQPPSFKDSCFIRRKVYDNLPVNGTAHTFTMMSDVVMPLIKYDLKTGYPWVFLQFTVSGQPAKLRKYHSLKTVKESSDNCKAGQNNSGNPDAPPAPQPEAPTTTAPVVTPVSPPAAPAPQPVAPSAPVLTTTAPKPTPPVVTSPATTTPKQTVTTPRHTTDQTNNTQTQPASTTPVTTQAAPASTTPTTPVVPVTTTSTTTTPAVTSTTPVSPTTTTSTTNMPSQNDPTSDRFTKNHFPLKDLLKGLTNHTHDYTHHGDPKP